MKRLLLITFLALAICQSPAAEGTVSPVLQQAYDQLISTRFFAFGTTGFECTTSLGELSFRTLAASPEGLPLFRAALTNGTPEAKLYALCGIRHLAPEQFDAVAAPIIESNSRVGLLIGSLQMQMRAGQLVTQIRRGSYDDWFPRGVTKRSNERREAR